MISGSVSLSVNISSSLCIVLHNLFNSMQLLKNYLLQNILVNTIVYEYSLRFLEHHWCCLDTLSLILFCNKIFYFFYLSIKCIRLLYMRESVWRYFWQSYIYKLTKIHEISKRKSEKKGLKNNNILSRFH